MGHGRAALHHQLHHSAVTEVHKQVIELAAPFETGVDLGAGRRRTQNHTAGTHNLGGVDGSVVSGPVAHPQRRIVAADRARTHDNGVRDCSQVVNIGPCGPPGDPLGRRVGRGCAAVEGCRQFEHHPWPVGSTMVQVRPQLRVDLFGSHTDGDFYVGRKETLEAAAGDQRVRIFDSPDDPGHPGLDQCLRAGACATAMIAGFKRAVEGRAPGLRRFGEGHNFGVGASGRFRRTRHHRTVGLDQHGPYPRVRGAAMPSLSSRFDRQPHVVLVEVRLHSPANCDCGGGGRSCQPAAEPRGGAHQGPRPRSRCIPSTIPGC